MPDRDFERRVMWKVTLRLIPFLFLLYIVAFLDRVNVTFAELQMSGDLKFTKEIYGTGAGIFFWGYFFFEVPSNLIMERTGARIWIARIMFTWGLISAAMMFVAGEWGFYSLRFLLGLAEAGFFPGMILYLTYWYTRAERARAVAWFMTAVPLAGFIGNPISGVLMKHCDGLLGLRGWQWMFLLEGLPAIALGGVVLWYLTDRPEKAEWLEADERDWLVDRLKREHTHDSGHGLNSLWQGLLNPRVLLMSLLYLSIVVGSYGLQFFMPQIIKFRGVSDEDTLGYLTAIPNLAAAVGMVLIGMSSDRFGERRWHVALSSALAAAGLLGCAYTRSVTGSVIAMSVASVGLRGTLGPFWALSTSFLGGAAAAGGIALINSIGNLGGYFGPSWMGKFHDYTGSYQTGLTILAGSLVASGLIALSVRPAARGASRPAETAVAPLSK